MTTPPPAPKPDPAADFAAVAAWTPHGRALLDHAAGDPDAVVVVHATDGEPETVHAASFFRDADAFEPWVRT